MSLFEERLRNFRLIRLMIEAGIFYSLFDCRFRFYMSVLKEMSSGRASIWHLERSRLGESILKNTMRTLLMEKGHFCLKLTLFSFLRSVN